MDETPENDVAPEVLEPEKVETATLEDLEDVERPTAEVVINTRRGQRKLVFGALPRPEYDDLITAHPPEPGVDVDGKGVPLRWNQRTFQQALVAACSIEPVMSEAEVNRLWRKWNRSSTIAVFTAALDLNETEGVVDLGKSFPDSGLIRYLRQNLGGS